MYTKLENFIRRESDRLFIPIDPDNTDYQQYQAWLAEGNVPTDPSAPTVADLINANKAAIQSALDAQAQKDDFDNIISACTYANDAVTSPFQAQGAKYVRWRSAVWEKAYAVLADVQAGKAPMPTPEQAVADMPPFDSA